MVLHWHVQAPILGLGWLLEIERLLYSHHGLVIKYGAFLDGTGKPVAHSLKKKKKKNMVS